MKSLFLSISLLFVSTSFAQKLLPERDVRQQVFAGEKFFKLYTTDEPLDGTYKVVMSGGAYYEATFVEGRINGAYKRYNGEGKLTAEEHYKNGKNDGTWKYYNDKGKLISLKNYKDGKPWGKWQLWDDDAEWLQSESDYKGEKNYTLRIYYDNGKLSEEHTYKEGKEDGSQKYYQREG